MAEKDVDKMHDGDEDYGLPKVDISPIGEKPISASTPPLVSEGAKPLPTGAEISAVENKEKGTVQKPIPITPEKTETKKERKGNNSWLLWLLLLLILCLGGWYYYVNNTEQIIPPPPPIVEEEIKEELPPITEDVKDEPLPIEPEEEEITLAVISSRAENPRYFVVVGSFIDEDMAMDYSKDLIQKGMNTYLVHPYGQIAYYRLAIGQFESFALAAVEMDRVQGDFKENLWVLKY